MTKKIKTLFLFAVLLPLFITCAMADSISWYYSYSDGLASAKTYNKPVMMDVFIQGCGFCDRLNNETFTDPDVIALSKNFICVKLDADKYPAIDNKYNVDGYPTILFLKPDGGVIHTIPEFRPPAPFISDMKTALKKYGVTPEINPQPYESSVGLPVSVNFSNGYAESSKAKISLLSCDFSNAYDKSYHLRMLYPGKSVLTVEFNLAGQAKGGEACLYLTHLTSMAGSQNGWAPVTISVNGKKLASATDSGSGSYVTAKFNVSHLLTEGKNIIKLELDSNAETHYWLKSLEIK